MPYSAGTEDPSIQLLPRFVHDREGVRAAVVGSDARPPTPSRGKTNMRMERGAPRIGMHLHGGEFPGRVVDRAEVRKAKPPPTPSLDQIKRQLAEIHDRIEAMKQRSKSR